MTDEIVIQKLSEKTLKSKDEIENILENIDIKFIKWMSDKDFANTILPILVMDGIVSKFLIIKIIKAIFK
jgi:hypothetical protein